MRRVMGRCFARMEGRGAAGRLPLIHHFALHFVLRGEGATQSDLARFLGVTGGYVTGLVDTLEREGLVRRVRDESDRRRIQLKAGPKARRFHRQLHAQVLESTAPLFREWSDQEIDALRDMLRRLAGGEDRPADSYPHLSVRS